jgi:hypothetical protein
VAATRAMFMKYSSQLTRSSMALLEVDRHPTPRGRRPAARRR